ncbi:major capsid protein [Capybara microvirus Cap3_SP_414]|nr:major capsid protein [Capybara microvirus Cap3_SP_414]
MSNNKIFQAEIVEKEYQSRNEFDFTHDNLTTLDMGNIVPLDSVLLFPGDICDISSETYFQTHPCITNLLSKVYCDELDFIAPLSRVWTLWQDYISPGNGTRPLSHTDPYRTPTKPYFVFEDIILASLQTSFSILNFDINFTYAPMKQRQFMLIDYLHYPIQNFISRSDLDLSNLHTFRNYVKLSQTNQTPINLKRIGLTPNYYRGVANLLNDLLPTSLQNKIYIHQVYEEVGKVPYNAIIYLSDVINAWLYDLEIIFPVNYYNDVSSVPDFNEIILLSIIECLANQKSDPLVYCNSDIYDPYHDVKYNDYSYFRNNNLNLVMYYCDFANSFPSETKEILKKCFYVAGGVRQTIYKVEPNELDTTNYQVIDALEFYAYLKVCCDYFRDQNYDILEVLISESVKSNLNSKFQLTQEGYLSPSSIPELFVSCYKKDYFTTATETAQRGNPIEIPTTYITLPDPVIGGTASKVRMNVFDPQNPFVIFDNDSTMKSLSISGTSQPLTVLDLRKYISINHYVESCLTSGMRYAEYFYMQWDVVVPDAVTQETELINAKNQIFNFQKVVNTGNNDLPLGSLASNGFSIDSSSSQRIHQNEHAFYFKFIRILPDLYYYGGIQRNKLFQKYLDYPLPQFSSLGNEEIYSNEVLFQFSNAKNIFGYNSRYSYSKFEPNKVSGDFCNSLSSQAFIRNLNEEDSDLSLRCSYEFNLVVNDKRPFAVISPNYDSYICHSLIKFNNWRKLPVYGLPGIHTI